MSFSVADRDLAVAALEERGWKQVALVFESGVGVNSLMPFGTKMSCDVPHEEKPTIAKMQWQMRHLLEHAFRLGDASFRDFYEKTRTWKKWKIGNQPDFPTHFTPPDQEAHRLIDQYATLCALPEQTVKWYRTVYKAIVSHGERIMALSAKHSTPAALFEHVTQQSPCGTVDAIMGPQAMHFRCQEYADYEKLYHGADAAVTEPSRQRASSTLGMCKTGGKTPEEAIVLTGENYGIRKHPSSQKLFPSTVVHRHELTHARTRFFQHQSTAYFAGKSPSIQNAQNRCISYIIGPKLQDEMISWTVSPGTAMKNVFFSKNTIYNYASDFAGWLTENANLPGGPGFSEENILEAKKSAQQYMNVSVPAAESALSALAKDYPMPIVREMLRITPLAEWSELAKKLTGR